MREPRTPGGWQALATLGVALAATLLVVFGASPLPRLTPDSATYLTGAEQIAEGNGFVTCSGPVTLFAPGYAAAIAPLVAAGVAAPDAARIVNALATLALVLGVGLLARGTGLTRNRSLVVALAVGASFAVVRNGALVWSEPLFCSLLVWLLVLAVDDGRGLVAQVSWRLAGVAVLAWAVLLTRHSGVFVLPALLLAVWLGSRALSHRVLRVAGVAVLLTAVPAVWWLRNVDLEGDPFGRRSGSRYSALEVLGQFPDGLSSLTLPDAVPLALRLVVLVPLVVAALVAWRRSEASGTVRLSVSVLSVAVGTYALGVTAAAMRTVVDPIDARLLSPVLAPAAVLVALGTASPRTRLHRGLAAWAIACVCLLAALAPGVAWRSHQADRDLSNVPDDVSCAEWPASYSAG